MFLVPGKQAPPDYVAMGPNFILLKWNPPDFPNGILEMYRLYRDDVLLISLPPNGISLSPSGILLSPNGITLSPNGILLSPNGILLSPMCLLSATFLRHFSLAVARLRVPLSRPTFLEGALYKYPE